MYSIYIHIVHYTCITSESEPDVFHASHLLYIYIYIYIYIYTHTVYNHVCVFVDLDR